jgi:AcrR family transcriptional regulator
MPRNSAFEAARTKERILDAAVARASRFGLESVSIGELAGDLEMSRSGVIGPFRSRDDLLGAALDSAVSLFRATVIEPALDTPPGLPRVAAIVDRWIGYLVSCPFPGGCFVTMASVELDGRPGPRRDHLARVVARWRCSSASRWRPTRRSSSCATPKPALAPEPRCSGHWTHTWPRGPYGRERIRRRRGRQLSHESCHVLCPARRAVATRLALTRLVPGTACQLPA